MVTKRLLIFCILATCLGGGAGFAIAMTELEYGIDISPLDYVIYTGITAMCTYFATRSSALSE